MKSRDELLSGARLKAPKQKWWQRHELPTFREAFTGELDLSFFTYSPIVIEGQARRGIRAECGHCGEADNIPFNRLKVADDDREIKLIAQKLERLGWKIGKSPGQNRCPKCFTAIKVMAKRKGEENRKMAASNGSGSNVKLMTPIATVSERKMTRDDRRLIIEKIREVFISEAVGYAGDWSDDKIATDMGVPRAWVASIRDETFGPDDTNEEKAKTKVDAEGWLEEQKSVRCEAERLLLRMSALEKAAGAIHKALEQTKDGKR